MLSAHCLYAMSNEAKFHENPLKVIEDMEKTQKIQV